MTVFYHINTLLENIESIGTKRGVIETLNPFLSVTIFDHLLASDDHIVVDGTISSVVFLNWDLLVKANDLFER